MDIKDINRLGKEINKISKDYQIKIQYVIDSIPEKTPIIRFKKSGKELVDINYFKSEIDKYLDIIKLKNQAWSEMIKLFEKFAIKEAEKTKPKRRKKNESSKTRN